MRHRFFAVLLIAGVTVFHLWYIASGRVDLAPDEAHYWEWSRRLDWSYYSKGPMVAYLIALSTRLGGSSEFFVRLPAVLLALGIQIILYVLTRALFTSERAAFMALLIAACLPLFSAGSVLMTIDAPLMFFWAATIFAFWQVIQTRADRRRGNRWWIFLGLALGLGLLSKYTMALFVPCALLCLALSSEKSIQPGRRGFPVAVLVAAILFTPVLVWNAQHQWVSLRHVAGQAGLSGDAQSNFLQFLGSQIGVVSPLLFLALIAAMFRCWRLRAVETRERSLFLVTFSAPVLLFFLSWSLFSKVEANWAAPGYLAAVIALAAGGTTAGRKEIDVEAERAIFCHIAAGRFPCPGAHFPAALNLVGIDLPPRLDPTRRLHGWKN
jgi:undecaprenyl-diphosphatase